jgi:hypothetical protein
MRHSSWPVILSAAVALVAAVVSLPAAAENSQQSKMTSCNADAKAQGLAGDARKAYMKTCLSAKPSAAKPVNAQQTKMKSCNAEATAKGLKGAERKTFMSGCLKDTATP